MEIKRNSLIFKIAKFGNIEDHGITNEYNICDINRCILKGIGLGLIVLSLTLLFLNFLITPIYYLIISIINNSIIIPDGKDLMAVSFEVGILLYVGLFIWFLYDHFQSIKTKLKKKYDHNYEKQPSKIYQCWKAFKDKVCFRVTITD